MAETDKARYHREASEAAEALGGMNPFLQLIEALRGEKTSPLTSGNSIFRSPLGVIRWDKVIFQDKVQLLVGLLSDEERQANLLASPEDKQYKKILNLVRTLKPVTFTVIPDEGEKFSFVCFESTGDSETRVSVFFHVFFFCPVNEIKKILKYQPKD